MRSPPVLLFLESLSTFLFLVLLFRHFGYFRAVSAVQVKCRSNGGASTVHDVLSLQWIYLAPSPKAAIVAQLRGELCGDTRVWLTLSVCIDLWFVVAALSMQNRQFALHFQDPSGV